MRMISRTCALTALAAPLAQAPAGAEERKDTITSAYAYVAPTCPVTPNTAIQKEVDEGRLEFLGPVLGMIVAGLVGDLVKSGVSAAGDALQQASREQGFGVEGTTWYHSATLRPRSKDNPLARATRNPACLVMFTQDGKGAEIASFPQIIEGDAAIAAASAKIGATSLVMDTGDDGQAAMETLQARGATRDPGLYVEARILSGKEGVIIRPVLVRYARALSGSAPRTPAAAELHVTLAAPGPENIGKAFATVRLKLPKIAPGQTLTWNELRASASPMMAARPTEGTVDGALANANGAYAALSTRRRELVVAERALLAAEARLRAKPADADLIAVRTAASDAVSDAKAAVSAAESAANAVSESPIGATNVAVRFVVIRSEDKFGMALANAIKGQAAAAGKAATEALAPRPEFTANDTAYLAASAALDAKQREYDASITAGDAATIAKVLGELNVAKAKLNEAAVAIRRPIPYPGLLN